MGGRALRSGVRAAQRRDNRCVPRPRDPAGAARRRLQPAAALHPDALPGWTPSVEVYHGTAPLLQSGAPPLSRLVLDRLRGQSGASWGRGVALAPLFDRDRWEVVGAVAIRPAGIAPGWLGGWTLPALALFAAAALGALRAVGGEWERVRRALRAYGAAGVLFGAAAYANVQQAARASTDQWLADARLL